MNFAYPKNLMDYNRWGKHIFGFHYNFWKELEKLYVGKLKFVIVVYNIILFRGQTIRGLGDPSVTCSNCKGNLNLMLTSIVNP